MGLGGGPQTEVVMSTVELSKTRHATPHTAVMRRRAALVRRGRKLLRATEELLSTHEECSSKDAAHLNVLVAQLDVLNAEVSERLSSARVDEGGPTLAQLGSALVDLQ